MNFQWSSDSVPQRDRFAYFREVICAAVSEVSLLRRSSGPFRAHVFARDIGAGGLFEMKADGHRIRREATNSDSYYMWCQRSENMLIRSAHATFDVAPGDVIFGSFADELEVNGNRYDMASWEIPRALVDPFLARSPNAALIHLRGDMAVANVLWTYLESIATQLERFEPPMLESVVQNAGRLAALAIGHRADAQDMARDAVRAATLQRAYDYIEAHLADAHLTPTSTASALGISLRALHLLFEPTGTSFAKRVARRRLETCYAMLVHPTCVRRPIAEVAFACGFNDLSTFYRAFSAAYGTTPREIRAGITSA